MTAAIAVRDVKQTFIVVMTDSLIGGDQDGNHPSIGPKLSILGERLAIFSVGYGPNIHSEIRTMPISAANVRGVAEALRKTFFGRDEAYQFTLCVAGFQEDRAVLLAVEFPSGIVSEPVPVAVAHPSNDAYSRLLSFSQDSSLEPDELCRKVHRMMLEAIELDPKRIGPPIEAYLITQDGARLWRPAA